MKYTRILKKGCRGEDVKYIQECLITLGHSVGASKADGIFGSNTETAVEKYQKSHKDIFGKALSVDGKIGEKTWTAIERDYKASNNNEAKYTRLLKKTSPLMKGEDVKFVQQKLIDLGHDVGNTGADGQYGNDTVSAVKEFQQDKDLSVDGIVGEKTWNALVNAKQDSSNGIKYSRVLKQGMSGDDVRYMKDCLFTLNYYTSDIKKITNSTFGNDTVKAVKLYQQHNKDTSGRALLVDGKIGEKTWGAVKRDYKNNKKYSSTSEKEENNSSTIDYSLDSYTHITADKREKIEKDLAKVRDIRKKIVLEILDYAYDKDVGGDVRALYIFGANLYNTSLKINYADNSEIDKAAKTWPGYFNGGRKDWMKEQVKRNSKLPAADCSGMEVGYLRKHKLVSNTFDTTANNLCSDRCSSVISKDNLKPGDWVGFNGHIGTYVGAGYVVEFAGGAYGCQLTKLDDRELYDFIKKKVVNGSKWSKFRRPKFY